MSFTGKATYSAGATLPEIAEDVADVISIISPYETPLLHHLGDAQRSATSTQHEWLEDSLLPNTDLVSDSSISNPATETSWDVALAYIADKLKTIKEKNGPDAIAGLSSARCTNEENYLFQKFMRAVIGTNNVDHCARL